jgi:hypothetical protein
VRVTVEITEYQSYYKYGGKLMLKEYYEIINLAKNEPTTLRGIVAKIAILECAAGWNVNDSPDIFEVSLEKKFNADVDYLTSTNWDLNQLQGELMGAKKKYYEWSNPDLREPWEKYPNRLATLQTHPELEGII